DVGGWRCHVVGHKSLEQPRALGPARGLVNFADARLAGRIARSGGAIGIESSEAIEADHVDEIGLLRVEALVEPVLTAGSVRGAGVLLEGATKSARFTLGRAVGNPERELRHMLPSLNGCSK